MPERRQLDGWKQIGDYLGVHARTAQRLAEQHGLPVVGGGRKIAFTDLLDLWRATGRRRLEPQSAALSGNVLTAYIADVPLWKHQFSEPSCSIEENRSAWRLQVRELTGCSGNCVLVACRFLPESAHSHTAREVLFCFGPDGVLRWSIPADPGLLDRDERPFHKAWRFTHMVVDPPVADQSLWLALANDAGWAGCVLRVTPDGVPIVHIANAGHVERLCSVATPVGNQIIFCGENNDYDRAFVASFRVADPPSTSPPGDRPRYRYANAPTGALRKYFLFPRTELIEARDKPYGHAWLIEQFPDDIVVLVDTGGDGGYFLYHFAECLEPAYVFPSGSHEYRHRTLEREGKIAHAWEACPEVRTPLTVRLWESATGWRDQRIPWRDTYPQGY
jgi:hypothetical protein